jgi:hypothetical protein
VPRYLQQLALKLVVDFRDLRDGISAQRAENALPACS